MLRSLKTLSLMASLAVVACTTPATNPHFKVGKPYTVEGKQYVPSINPKYAEIGIASWYGNGDGFHNQLTANGELFDKDGLTAAHKTLPLPSIVTVTNLENGKSLKLRVNDRGPFVAGRIIDVSERAAKELDFHSKGMAKVLVELDREGSMKAVNNIKINDDERANIVAAYNGDATYIEPTKNEDIKIITTALKEESNNLPRSMQKAAPVEDVAVAVATPQVSSPDEVVDKIVIREEIVRPDNSTPVVTVDTRGVVSSPKSMLNAVPKNHTTTYSSDEKGIFVQIASLNDITKASEISRDVNRFASSKVMDAIVNGKQYYRVRLGTFDTKSDAEVALGNIKKNGYTDAFIVTE